MSLSSEIEQLRERFRRFADVECKGYSDWYYNLAHAVADDESLLQFIAQMADGQPNLFLASVQYLAGLAGMPTDSSELRAFVANRSAELATVMRSHRTQTNEVGRCAVLLPAIPPGPVALIEVGSSAGLCLMLDRYYYDYGSIQVGDPASAVRLSCRLSGENVPALSLPEIVWRRGLDIAPIDLNDVEAVQWLLACVWPDHEARRQRLKDAIQVCRNEAPPVLQGDLIDDFEPLFAQVPRDVTPVVVHSVVFPYISLDRRRSFEGMLRELSKQRDIVWISYEGRGALPEVAHIAPEGAPSQTLLTRTHCHEGEFDHHVLGLAHPHGADLVWLA